MNRIKNSWTVENECGGVENTHLTEKEAMALGQHLANQCRRPFFAYVTVGGGHTVRFDPQAPMLGPFPMGR